jgi:hypothetical protein
MSVPPVLSLVTLGVRDVEASTRFYVALGFPLSSASVPGEVSFFSTSGGLLAVWGADALAADARVDPHPTGTFSGVALAINVESREAVHTAIAAAAGAGAHVLKPAEETEWGGYQGYFADPDGHAWAVAHNPFWPLDENGLPQLP